MYRLIKVFRRSFSSAVRSSNPLSVNDAAKFYAPHFGVSVSTMYKWLQQNPSVIELDREDTAKKVLYLKHVNVTADEIFQKPQILSYHLVTLENRTTIMRECGLVETLDLNIICNSLRLLRKSIDQLKRHQLIPKDLNMYEQLKRQFEHPIEPRFRWDDQTVLQDMRVPFIDEFLSQRLTLTEADREKLWKSYSKIKYKSFGHTQRVLDILQYEYKFSRDKLIANMYLLHADPENLLRYPEQVPAIGGIELKELAVKYPKIVMVNHATVAKTIAILNQHSIPEAELLKCLCILTLAPSTIEKRIERLKSVKEFEVLAKHPRVLKLIQYQTKATIRLEYLQQLKVRCASLDVLSSHSQNFERYVREGCDRTKGKDTAHFLKAMFGEGGEAALQKIKRHPNWFHVPIVQMKDTVEALLKQQYTNDDILDNVHILLYPLNRIEEKLQVLANKAKVNEDLGLDVSQASQTQKLALALYLIELEFHFTGDGVWPEQMQQSDSTSSITIELPESLSTEYKFGKKPPATTTPS
ncbi:transcription termination factor 5, mitochondrial [Anopheles darlingi]|uniref:transcription termination factor 5, mitochondrial n=1 Tax=Anopheles darlingi TaxID=43151 RepID=UPI0021000A85|nr:transcription termination factor 5, mitochondrial [Anopheles darlingi]